MSKMKSGFRGSLVTGVAMLTIGLVFLMDNLGLMDVAIIWPIIPIGIGLAMVIMHFKHPPRTSSNEKSKG